ncbi:hypothetical protein WMY93_015365 [Mugilogobius chulae]|uniref:KASH domain-containing protein n=1 Tax=Mugilogobius chulae TaxID=88201 RepID=A0AAW0NUA2_9GOBI
MARRPTLCVPTDQSDLTHSSSGEGAGTIADLDCPSMVVQTMDGGDSTASVGRTLAPSIETGPPISGGRGNLPSPPGPGGTLGLARERWNLNAAGLPAPVIDTIQCARAKSTRSLYDCKWRIFEQWCEARHVIPFQCSVSEVLCFLQQMVEKRRAFSTLKVYLAAISACHVGFGDKTVGQHPLISRFMKGARRKLPVVKPLVPLWDLSVVLDALCHHPFEPLEAVALKYVALKTVLLLALTSAKRVSELQAFSVSPTCMQFAPGLSKVHLRPNPAFMPKVEPAYSCPTLEIAAFHPPPFSSPEEQQLHSLCPVRALRVYVDRTAGLRKADQLFVSWASSHMGKPVSSQRLSHWIVEAISLAYTCKGIAPPQGLRAHSTRGVATSWALFRGISGPSNEETSAPPQNMSWLQEENRSEEQSWSQLSDQISQTLSGLHQLHQDSQISKEKTITKAACLDQTHLAVLTLTSVVNSSGSCERGELFKALKQVVRSLDALTTLLSASVQDDDDDPELRLLQDECLKEELVTLSELLNQTETVDTPEASQCISSVQQCVGRVSLSNRLVCEDYLHLGTNKVIQSSAETPKLLCVLVEHLRQSPGAGAELRQASRSLLQGMRTLVEVGEECTAEGQTLTAHSQRELQDALQRLKKLQEVLASQLAFAHHLFQREALKCPDDEWAQLQVRAKVVQQQALEQQAAFQCSLQEWTQWEENCAHVGKVLCESEAFLNTDQLKGDETEEKRHKRIQGCQTILSKLDQSRLKLGLVLDEENTSNKQETWASLQTDVASLNQWLLKAEEQVQMCSDLAVTSDPTPECVHNSLIRLLDLSVEVGSMSHLKESIHLKAGPSEREQLTDLETQWKQLTSALCTTQEQLQQHLLRKSPLDGTLSALEDWLKDKQKHLNDDVCVSLPELKGLKRGLELGQLLLDVLCQSEPPLVGEEAITLRSERTMLAEKLGALRLPWVGLQGELQIQINEAEHMHQTQARKQRKLQHLQKFMDQMKKKAADLRRACGGGLARRLQLEWEGYVESLKDVEADMEELKVEVCSDDVFTEQVEELGRTYDDLLKQIESLDPSVQQSAQKWTYFKNRLNKTSLSTARLRCSLQQLRSPVFSFQQAQKQLLLLQEIQSTTNDSEDLWEELDRCCRDLVKTDQDVELQEKVDSVESVLYSSLAASKRLIKQLDPVASNIVQSQTSQLSRDDFILSQALQVLKKNTQEDINQLNTFTEHLDKLENQVKEQEERSKGANDDCAKVFWELSNLFSSMFDVSEMRAHVNLSNQQEQRLHQLQDRYVQSLRLRLNQYKLLQHQHHQSLDFDGKCKALTDIQDKLEQESTWTEHQSYNSLKQMTVVLQKLQGDIAVGHQLLRGIFCDAVKIIENKTHTERSETLAKVSQVKQKWTDTLNQLTRRECVVKQQLSHYTTYQRGLKHVHSLIRDLESLLPPTGHIISVSQLHTQDYETALQPHSDVFSRTVNAGRTLCRSMTDPDAQTQLQTEIQALEEAWERTVSQLRTQKDVIHNTVQKWRQCQEKITELRSELDQCGLELKQTVPDCARSQDQEKIIQESEFSLQLVKTGRLQEVDRMKMDLSHYVPLEDSALLEQQLEQLHSHGKNCVSLRKQEIADRLNAWTIFNDKNKEFCDWLTQMENKVCHSAGRSFEEMVEKLKKDCMEEMNLFSENKKHLKQLGEQLLWASDEAKQSQVHGTLQEANQRWYSLFHHIETRVKKLKETLGAVQQLDKNMNNLRSWLCRIEAELSRPITYSVLHHQEIQKKLAEHQELQRDIEQHTDGVTSVLNLCDVLLQDEDASHGTGTDTDSLQETSHSLDQRWRSICAMALDRRLRIEETWRLWCKFLDDYSRFEDWLKMAERTAANPNTGAVPYAAAKEELKKFESFQRQVNERLTQLEIVNNQYRRLARENRTDRASQLKSMVHQGNRRWDVLHRRVGAILRRLKYFTSQREEFESTRESMLVWLTELDLQLTNVEHFSESDVHHKIQQLNSFQREIRLNTERIDGLIVFGEGLIQRSAPEDAALIEEELEELHLYCQEVFNRLVRFHQRLSQPPLPVEPESPIPSFSLESSLELIGRPWLGRSLSSPLATPTHLLTTPLSRSGRETPVSVDSLPLEWDHTGDVGGSSSHEDEDDDEGAYFSAVSSRSVCDSPRWRTQDDPELLHLKPNGQDEAPPTLSSTPLKQGNYVQLMSQCGGSVEDFRRVSLILDDDDSPDEFGLVGLNVSGDKQSQADLRTDPEQEQLSRGLDHISSWLDTVSPRLQHVLQSDPPSSVEAMSSQATQLKEMQRALAQYKSSLLSLNLSLGADADVQEKLSWVNQKWSRACTDLQHWDTALRKTLLRCQEFHESLHCLLLWLAHAESRRFAVDIHHPETSVKALKQHSNTLTEVREELVRRQTQQDALQALWTQLQPEPQDHDTQDKLLENEATSDEPDQRASSVSAESRTKSHNTRDHGEPAQRRSFLARLLRAVFPLHLLLLLLLLLPCLVPLSQPENSCSGANNFARSFYPMLRYTNGPRPHECSNPRRTPGFVRPGE